MRDDCWFAVQTTSRREQVAAQLLTQKGYECFLPTYKGGDSERPRDSDDRNRDKNKDKNKDKPLFPGYLFCRITASTSAKLITTPAVLGIVSFAGKTAYLSAREMEDLKLVLNSGLPREPIPHLLPGTRVRIKTGPLAGAEGIVDVSNRKGRFVVSVSLLQRSVGVTFDADVLASMMIEPVGSGPKDIRPGLVN